MLGMTASPRPYHHGHLREALLREAEKALEIFRELAEIEGLADDIARAEAMRAAPRGSAIREAQSHYGIC